MNNIRLGLIVSKLTENLKYTRTYCGRAVVLNETRLNC